MNARQRRVNRRAWQRAAARAIKEDREHRSRYRWMYGPDMMQPSLRAQIQAEAAEQFAREMDAEIFAEVESMKGWSKNNGIG